MTPASRLPVEAGDYVLDLCAAPGGKATELGAKLKGTGFLLANDISNSRAKALLKNLELAGIPNIYVTSEDPEKLTRQFPEFFHKILIDAPCSGEGMFHKEPKMAEYWEEKPPAYYAEIQKKLLEQGAQMLRPGGMLLYSTCTFSKKENEEVIAHLLSRREDMEVVTPVWYEGFVHGFPLEEVSEEVNRQLASCIRIFPHRMPGEGHFAALLRKKGLKEEDRNVASATGGKKNTAALYLQADRFVKSLIAEKDYEVDIETKTVSLTPKGIEKAEKGFKIDNLYDIQHTSLVHHINQALKANYAMTRDVEYMIATEDGTRDIRNAKIMIIDQFTGRVMPGRAYSDGLHQAIEAKEGVPIKEETETRATITYQNFFRLFNKLAGMTGTAKTEEEEFMMIYNMRVIEIPTNKPVIRDDRNDKIYSTKTNKFKALCDEVVARHAYGQPILIGTVSVETSEILSKMLDKRGIKHNTLNAKNHAKEAEIIARAGQKGAVTIATNMAGRGTDIKLGKGVPEIGGLAVIGSERHESRRIDNQLRGRSGRQGDPGYSVFYVSFDDELMQRFAGEKLQSFSNYLDDDMAIENKMVSKAIENAQKRVEGQNFDSRKHILEYDDVMRQQREIMYKERDEIMSLDNLDDIVKGMFNQAIEMTINRCTTHGKHDEVDVDAVLDFVAKNYMLLAEIDAKNKDVVKNDPKKLLETLTEICFSQYQMRLNKDIDHAKIVNYERSVLLGVIDYTWINHIDAMTKLRNGIYLRAYAQKNPLSEYTEEAFYMFEQMKLSIVDMISKNIVHMGIRPGSSAEENIPHLKLEVEFK